MERLIRVSPSILAIDYKDDAILKKALVDIERAGANFVHLDVMDGKFVKNTTFDHTFVYKVRGMTGLLLDVHLMIENPDEQIENYANAGADIITVHYEACKDIASTLKKIKERNIIAGVALNPKTSVLKIKDLLEKKLVDLVLIMSVNPGKAGQEFIRGSAEKVAEVRDLSKKVFVEVDGGINLKVARRLRKLGANILVSSSFLFKQKNLKKTIKQLKGRGIINKIQEFFS